MPIADLFSASATSNPVGTGRNGRNSQQQRAIEAFRPSYSSVGTVGTGPGSLPQCSDRSDQPANRSEQEKPSVPRPVPTVPTVPTANHDVADCCRHCGALLAWPGPAGIVLGDGTAECQPCADVEAWRLLEAGRRAVKSPDALADPAEVMLRGELT